VNAPRTGPRLATGSWPLSDSSTAGDLGGSAGSAERKAENAILRQVGASPTPVGCSRVREALHNAGLTVSEATAGRLLRTLDLKGLTVVSGNRGRVLTEQGRRYLAELERTQRQYSHDDDLLRAIRADRIEDVVDLIRVRLPVEVEAARLAALKASEAEVAELEAEAERYIADTRQGKPVSEHNLAFHRLLARAAKSRIIQAVVEALLEEEQLHDVLRDIQDSTGGRVPEEHRAIAQAVRSRQPDAAAAAMRAHLERIGKAIDDSGVARHLGAPEA
jgi:GntR family transcriptional regulator, transcriptional repressor for pyruvate dehydrogenase complex